MMNRRHFACIIQGLLLLLTPSMHGHAPVTHSVRQKQKKQCVSLSPEIHSAEKAYIQERSAHAKKALESFLNRSIHPAYVPRISLCASGGGMRALCATTGLLEGLDQIGILDACLYMTGISGGSWAQIPWIAEGVSITEYGQNIRTRLTKGLRPSLVKQMIDISHGRHAKKKRGQPFNLVDAYGISLSHTFLKPFTKEHNSLTLSRLAPQLDHTRHPYPIFLASSKLDLFKNYHAIELSPHEVRLNNYNITMPAEHLGDRFNSGEVTAGYPEPSLGYILGILGSAFSLSISDLLEKGPRFLKKLLPFNSHEKIRRSRWGQTHIIPARVPNFTYNMRGTIASDKPHINLIDGGFRNNLPLSPLSHPERQQDIIFLLDSHLKSNRRRAIFRDILDFVKQEGGKLPELNAQDIERIYNEQMVIFSSDQPDTPTLIYISLLPEKPGSFDPSRTWFCKTQNFAYTPKQVDTVKNLVKNIIVQNKELLKQVVQASSEKKRQNTSISSWAISTIGSLFK